MSIEALVNRPATIIHRAPGTDTDGYGNLIDEETETDVLCEIQQQRRDERTDRGDVPAETWLLVLLPGTTIDAGDRIRVDGIEYQLFGPPWPARNPRTRVTSHIEATLVRAG